MFKFILPLLIFVGPSLGVNLSTEVRLLNGIDYFSRVLQETFYEIEEKGFCNLKLRDFNQNLNETFYNWHVQGTVSYSNGFVVSMDRIEMVNVRNGTTYRHDGVTTATFAANIVMHNVRVGYNVKAVLDREGTHVFTGIFTHSTLQTGVFLQKNLITGEITATQTTNDVSAGSGARMVYMPESNISEVLSRHFGGHVTFDNLALWTRNIILPTLVNKASAIKFPDFCINCG